MQLLGLVLLVCAVAEPPPQVHFSVPPHTDRRASLVPPSPSYVPPFPLHESLRDLYAGDSVPTTLEDDTPSTPERRAEMARLLDKFAPVFKLASTERYFPSSVDFMLKHYGFIEWKNGSQYIPAPGTFTTYGLSNMPDSGYGQLLSVNESCNPQPELEDEDSYFLYGPAGQPDVIREGRGKVHDVVYGFWVDMGRGVVVCWLCGLC